MTLNTIQLSIELPQIALLASEQHDPEIFVQEMRLTVAIKWYEIQRVSQEKAATIAGLSRSAFLLQGFVTFSWA